MNNNYFFGSEVLQVIANNSRSVTRGSTATADCQKVITLSSIPIFYKHYQGKKKKITNIYQTSLKNNWKDILLVIHFSFFYNVLLRWLGPFILYLGHTDVACHNCGFYLVLGSIFDIYVAARFWYYRCTATWIHKTYQNNFYINGILKQVRKISMYIIIYTL